jgi:hypothetical protein
MSVYRVTYSYVYDYALIVYIYGYKYVYTRMNIPDSTTVGLRVGMYKLMEGGYEKEEGGY